MLAQWGEVARREFGERLGAAMHYSLTAPGKRFRPALTAATFRAFGGDGDCSELGAAVEVVHTYSLVHDDLPCMDDDDLRRGRPTTHRRFDVATAAEAGFRMIPLSARVLAAGAARLGLPPVVVSRMGVELYRAAGIQGMIGGQVLDLEAEGREVSLSELVALHRSKTGALIAAAAVIGAIAAGASDAQVGAIRGYGRELGLAFQIVDDVLDATATAAALGKTAGKDARQRKASFVALMGVEGARAAAAEGIARGIDHLRALDVDCTLLTQLAHLVIARRS